MLLGDYLLILIRLVQAVDGENVADETGNVTAVTDEAGLGERV